MINENSLDLEWINKVSVENRRIDRILIEKVIRALYLLEGLAKVDLNFVFKGGTALMLLMDYPKRLSIDIDIIINNDQKELEKLFDEIVAQQFFTKFELQERITNSNIDKAHYKFYYNPIYRTQAKEEYILLDILFDVTEYQNIINIPVSSKFIKTEGKDIYVSIPSPEDLLGDKLTAFAPDTTGIPYYKSGTSMSMEIMKQLYDIGSLFDVSENMAVIKNTFKTFAKKELGYRDKAELNYDAVLEDIIQTSLCIVSRGAITSGNFNELQTGIQRVSHFIFSESFHLDKAIILASKAAYIANANRYDYKNDIEKYDNPLQVKEWKIDNPLWPR
ncbi:MAG: nucleotidyl transferase AbiEii/AbiGii toxin family protein [Bacteroidota bacterium]